MSTPADPVSGIKTELSGLSGDLIEVGLYGVGIGAAVLVLRKGWRTVKGFF